MALPGGIVSIDPGKKAGVALWAPGGKLVGSWAVDAQDFGTLLLIRDQITDVWKEHRVDLVVLEATSWHAKTHSACAKYRGGVLVGALGLQRIPLRWVSPRMWKSAVLGNPDAGKEAAVAYVSEVYGVHDATHDQAEAICIGEWAIGDASE